MGDVDILNAYREAIARALPDADQRTVDIAMAVTGLLTAVAMADRHIAPGEWRLLTKRLSGVEGFDSTQTEPIAQLVEQHAPRLSATYVPRFTRIVRELLPENARISVLDSLVRMAAADGTIAPEEVTNLRGITQAMGLGQSHYDELQSKYE